MGECLSLNLQIIPMQMQKRRNTTVNNSASAPWPNMSGYSQVGNHSDLMPTFKHKYVLICINVCLTPSLVIHAGMRWQSSQQLSNSLGLLICSERKTRTLLTVILKALHSHITKPQLVRELWLETQHWVPAPRAAPPYLGQMGEWVDPIAEPR